MLVHLCIQPYENRGQQGHVWVEYGGGLEDPSHGLLHVLGRRDRVKGLLNFTDGEDESPPPQGEVR